MQKITPYKSRKSTFNNLIGQSNGILSTTLSDHNILNKTGLCKTCVYVVVFFMEIGDLTGALKLDH